MYYHARITVKPDTTKRSPLNCLELDLSHEDLLEKMVLPFLRAETFFCGGTVVESKRVSDLRFSETTQPSAELLPFIRAEMKAKGYTSWIQDKWYVTDKGTDITCKMLDEGKQAVSVEAVKNVQPAITDKVFLVHGHDISALDQTEVLLRRWGLDRIILRDRANRGMTVIEKIEANTDVGYAIVLLTPDDLGGVEKEHLSPRARQNVIFEWGYLVARLGRARVACLCKDDIDLPSDLHGIVRINIGPDVRDSSEEIRHELINAGYRLRED